MHGICINSLLVFRMTLMLATSKQVWDIKLCTHLSSSSILSPGLSPWGKFPHLISVSFGWFKFNLLSTLKKYFNLSWTKAIAALHRVDWNILENILGSNSSKKKQKVNWPWHPVNKWGKIERIIDIWPRGKCLDVRLVLPSSRARFISVARDFCILIRNKEQRS